VNFADDFDYCQGYTNDSVTNPLWLFNRFALTNMLAPDCLVASGLNLHLVQICHIGGLDILLQVRAVFVVPESSRTMKG
jgi:hypothetical protein